MTSLVGSNGPFNSNPNSMVNRNVTSPTMVQLSFLTGELNNETSVVGTTPDGTYEDSWNQPVFFPNQDNSQTGNTNVENDKLGYINAQTRNDTGAMQRYAVDADKQRADGATLANGEDTAATIALKNYYSNDSIVVAALKSQSQSDLNKAIWKAKNDYTYALAHHDEAGMKAAAALAENMRILGGTIGSDVSLQDAYNIAFSKPETTPVPTPIPAPSQGTSASSSSNSLLPTSVEGVLEKVGGFLEGLGKSAYNNVIAPTQDPLGNLIKSAIGFVHMMKSGYESIDNKGLAQTCDDILSKIQTWYSDFQLLPAGTQGEIAGNAFGDILTFIESKKVGDDLSGAGAVDGVTEGTGEAFQLSSNSLKHVWNGHSYSSFESQLPYLLKTKSPQEVENILSKTTFFNKDLTKQEVGSIVEKATGEALSTGITNGTYTTTVEGQRVTVALEHGQFQTAYGDYHYSLSDFGY